MDKLIEITEVLDVVAVPILIVDSDHTLFFANQAAKQRFDFSTFSNIYTTEHLYCYSMTDLEGDSAVTYWRVKLYDAYTMLTLMTDYDVLDILPAVVWITGANRECIYVNQHGIAFIGYTLEDTLGFGWTKRIHPNDVQQSLDIYTAAFEARSPFEMEYRLQIADNSYCWVHDYGVPRYSIDGQFEGFIGVSVDVTKNHQTLDRLRQLSQAVEQSSSSVIITDLRGRIEYINQKFTQLTGYTFEEVQGRTPRILKSGHTTADEYKDLWLTIRQGKEWRGEFLNKRKDGGYYWEFASISPVFDERKRITNFVAVKEDITSRKEIELALESSEANYRTMISVMSEGIVVHDATGHIIIHNISAENILGMNADQIAGKTPVDPHWHTVHEDSTPFPGETHPAAITLQTGQPQHGVIMGVYKPNDVLTWIKINAEPLLIEGKLKGAVVTFTDITDLKAKTSALVYSEQLLHRTEVLAQVGGWEFRLQEKEIKDNIITWTDGIFYIYDYINDTELVTLEDALSGFMSPGNELILDHLSRLIETQESFNLELPFLTQRGYKRWVSLFAYIDLTVTPHRVYGTLQDITDRKGVELALKESEARFRQIAENVDEILYIKDYSSDTVLYMSPVYKRIWGDDPGVLYDNSANYVQQIHPDDVARVQEARQRQRDHQEWFSEEYRIIREDGDIRWVMVRTFPIYNENDEVYRLVGIINDVTERKQIIQKTLELSMERERIQILTKFIEGASHEFRTPLSVISSGAYLMMRSDDIEMRKTRLDKIEDQIHQINQLLDSLLLIVHLDSVKEPRLNLYETKRMISNVYQHIISKYEHVPITVNIQPDIPLLMLDAEWLPVALKQVLDNAMRYTQQGEIAVNVYVQAGMLCFDVKDTGIGMTTEQLPHVFEHFYRVDDARTLHGFGLGLSIVKRVMELLNGDVKIESVLGVGTTVSLRLPIIEANGG